MPRGKNIRRYRTNSQSSVEIQVSKEESIITTTTNVSSSSSLSSENQQALQVKPKADFLELLRNVGALGTQTSHGEIFTLKDLGQYLYKYIKERQLWDPCQPTVIHCDKDPLGNVFGVKTFTRADAETLLLKNAYPINLRKRRYQEVTSSYVEKASEGVLSQTEGNETTDISSTCLEDNTNPPPKKVHMSPHLELSSASSSSKVVDEINVTVYGRKSPSFREGHSSRKSPIDPKCFENSSKSPSSGSDASRRRNRQSSLSIVYEGSDRESSYPWFFRVELPVSDSEDEVYSVQSKTTDVVHSTNDEWSGDEELSIEIQSYRSDPHFASEFELGSESESSIDFTQEDDFSGSDEVLVVVGESDMDGFWADSESSDNESVISTDMELSESDKWTCTSCENRNTPVRSRCDKCWEVRPGWVTGNRRYPYRGRYRRQQQSRSAPSSPRPASSSEIASYSDHEVLVPSTSRTFSVKSLYDLAQFACNMRKINPANSSNTEVKPGQKNSDVTPSSVGTEDRDQEKQDSAPCESADKSLTSDGSEKTDILNSDDEKELSQRVEELKYENILKSRHNDSGVSESFTLSQDSIGGSSYNMSQQSITGGDSGLESSTGLTKSDILHEKKSLETQASVRSGDLGKSCSDSVKPSIKRWKSVKLPPKQSAQPPLAKSLTLPAPSTSETNLCAICFERPKNAVLVHGNRGHQLCCYPCGQTLKRNGMLCPVCKKHIEKVIVNFQA